MMYSLRALLAVWGALLLLSGCTVLPERSAKQTFLLPTPVFHASDRPILPITLRVLTPHTAAPLNGTQILVSPKNHTIQAYSGARWGKSMPLLVRDYWVEGLRQVQAFHAVIHETSNAASELSLGSDLTFFQLDYPSGLQGKPSVIVQMDAQLLESESGRVLAAKRFSVQQPAEAKPVEALISDFGSANQALADELANWLAAVSAEYAQETGQTRPLSDTKSSTIK